MPEKTSRSDDVPNAPFSGALADSTFSRVPQRWRDASENQALIQQVLESGDVSEKTVNETLDWHEKRGTDPSEVFRGFLGTAARRGLPAPEKTTPLELEPFEMDVLEGMIAGTIRTEVLVGDGALANLAADSLRDRVRPRSALAEIDASVAARAAAEEAFTNPKPDQEALD